MADLIFVLVAQLVSAFVPSIVAIEGSVETVKWPTTCYLTISQRGEVRVRGEDQRPCVEALEMATRLARAEIRVNGRKRR